MARHDRCARSRLELGRGHRLTQRVDERGPLGVVARRLPRHRRGARDRALVLLDLARRVVQAAGGVVRRDRPAVRRLVGARQPAAQRLLRVDRVLQRARAADRDRQLDLVAADVALVADVGRARDRRRERRRDADVDLDVADHVVAGGAVAVDQRLRGAAGPLAARAAERGDRGEHERRGPHCDLFPLESNSDRSRSSSSFKSSAVSEPPRSAGGAALAAPASSAALAAAPPLAPDASCLVSLGASSRPIFALSSASASSSLAPPAASSWRNFDSSVSPDSSPASSAPASASASMSWIRSAMRSNVSNALVSPSPCIVLAICCCASARFLRAMRMFFFRFASSILLLRRRSASFSFSTACFCWIHCCWNCVAIVSCSCFRASAWRARVSSPARTATIALRSHSFALSLSAVYCFWSFFSS